MLSEVRKNMELNLELCRTAAIQFGLPLQYVVKEFHVFDILSQITAATAPSKDFVFKGGTALNKAYFGKTQRFSEDLDFDLDATGLASVRSFSRTLSEKISGYETGEFRRVGDTIQFSCGYDNLLGGRDHVRVDIAAKKALTSRPLAIRPATSEFTGRFVTGFYTYSVEDLVARKLHALCTRAEGKDFFDVHNGLPLCGVMEKALAKMLESEESPETPREFIRKTAKAVKKADPSKLKNLTNPFIPTPVRPKDWGELKNDLVAKLEGME